VPFETACETLDAHAACSCRVKKIPSLQISRQLGQDGNKDITALVVCRSSPLFNLIRRPGDTSTDKH
jgi:hypothetical protein